MRIKFEEREASLILGFIIARHLETLTEEQKLNLSRESTKWNFILNNISWYENHLTSTKYYAVGRIKDFIGVISYTYVPVGTPGYLNKFCLGYIANEIFKLSIDLESKKTTRALLVEKILQEMKSLKKLIKK